MKNKNIPLKRGQIWLDRVDKLPAWKVLGPIGDKWRILHLLTGGEHTGTEGGLNANFILADESIIDQLLEKYS